jgi:hypothetical protein
MSMQPRLPGATPAKPRAVRAVAGCRVVEATDDRAHLIEVGRCRRQHVAVETDEQR